VQTFTSATPDHVSDSYQISLSGNTISGVTPYGTQYLAPDSNGNLQAWQLLFSSGTASQVGLISSVPWASTTICGTKTAARNDLQPATGFAILQYAVSPNICTPSGGEVTVLVNASDSDTTPPTSVPISQTDFADMYLTSGVLYGLVGLDPSTGNLNLYPATSGAPEFTTPTTLISGIASESNHTVTFNRSGQLANTVVFFALTFTGNPAPASKLVRVDTTGTATTVYTASGTLETDVSIAPPYDNTNFYFMDVVTGSGSTTYNFLKAPLASGNASLLYTVTAASGTTYSPVDSDGTSLIIKSVSAGTTKLYTLAVSGSSSQTPTQILQATASSVSAGLDYPSGKLFVNELVTGVAPTALVLQPSGSSPATPLAGPLLATEFSPLWTSAAFPSTSWLELSDLPISGQAGGLIEQLSITNLTTLTPFTCPLCNIAGNGNYTIPTGYSVEIGPIGAGLAAGLLTPLVSGPNDGLLLNLQTNQMAVYSVSGASLTAFY
jgi:hypothetical protein